MTTKIILEPSTIENVDYTIYEWVNEELNIFVDTSKGRRKIPVIFSSPERSFFVKEDKEIRDNYGTLQFPIISISRTGIKKPNTKRGAFAANRWPHNDYKKGSILIGRRISQDKSSDRANAESKKSFGQLYFPSKNKRIVYENLLVPQPVTIELEYNIGIITNLRQQMNEVLSVFLNKPGNINAFILNRNGHNYEVFMSEEYNIEDGTEAMENNERKFQVKIPITVVANLIGSENNQETPTVVIRESITDLIVKKEYILTGSIDDYLRNK